MSIQNPRTFTSWKGWASPVLLCRYAPIANDPPGIQAMTACCENSDAAVSICILPSFVPEESHPATVPVRTRSNKFKRRILPNCDTKMMVLFATHALWNGLVLLPVIVMRQEAPDFFPGYLCVDGIPRSIETMTTVRQVVKLVLNPRTLQGAFQDHTLTGRADPVSTAMQRQDWRHGSGM
jgi:hypothetical protein